VKIASSTYYVALTRLKSAREIRDEELKRLMQRAYDGNYKVYGARKVWWELREGIGVGRCRVERLIRNMGLVQNNGSGRRGSRGRRCASLCPIRTVLGLLSW
jgi:transposase InsO family protein